MVSNCASSQLFDGHEDTNSISNLLYTHLLQNDLVAFDQVASGDVVD